MTTLTSQKAVTTNPAALVRFIPTFMCFLPVHVACADRTDRDIRAAPAERKHNEQSAARFIAANGAEPLLGLRMRFIGQHHQSAPKGLLR